MLILQFSLAALDGWFVMLPIIDNRLQDFYLSHFCCVYVLTHMLMKDLNLENCDLNLVLVSFLLYDFCDKGMKDSYMSYSYDEEIGRFNS